MKHIVATFCGLILMLTASLVFAQTTVIPLVSVSDEAELTEATPWWVQEVPQANAFDETIQTSQPSSFRWKWGGDMSKVSKVLRREDLSESNAVALGTVLGGTHVLTGRVDVGKLDRIGAFDPQGVRASFAGELLLRTPKGIQIVSTLSFESVAFGSDSKGEVLRVLADAINAKIDADLVKSPGATGVVSGENVIILRGLQSGAQLTQVEMRLREHPNTQAVSIAWVIPGAVAIAINPTKDDSNEVIERVGQSLTSDFEGFRLVAGTSPFDDAITFDVQSP